MDTFALADRTVHRVGFGAMQLPGRGVFGPPRDHDEAIAVLRRAVELGVDHIDTAQYYGPDVSNRLIREALHPYPDDLALVSKVGAVRDDRGGWLPAQRPEELRAGVEDNLRTLAVERLAAVNLRRLDPEHVKPGTAVPLEDQLAEMVALREEGKIAGIGISNATIDQVRTAIDTAGVACVQNPFSLLDRHDADVLDLCADAGIAYVPFFPLGSAFPTMPKVTQDETVREVAERVGATPAQVGLAWLLAHRENVLLIPGTSRLAHLEENLRVADVVLSEDDLAELDKLAG
jgi:pyridoxine 4-dehydrogenase